MQHRDAAPDPFSPEALEGPPTLAEIPYYEPEAPDAYAERRCRLDLYVPPDATDFPTLVFFHGGGMTEGERNCQWGIPCRLAEAGIGCVVPGYRLSPKAQCPAYLEDAAAAIAWTINHIGEYGGDSGRVFVSGHSAGAFLSAMVALDNTWLAAHGLSPNGIAGAISVAGQMITHATIRAERGDSRPVLVDAYAPLGHVRADAPPMLLIVADEDIPARLEENRLMAAEMRLAGHPDIEELVAADREHVTVAEYMARPGDPTMQRVIDFVQARPKAIE